MRRGQLIHHIGSAWGQSDGEAETDNAGAKTVERAVPVRGEACGRSLILQQQGCAVQGQTVPPQAGGRQEAAWDGGSPTDLLVIALISPVAGGRSHLLKV